VLDPRKPFKPLDVGNGIVSGSLAPNGRWLSLGMTHPVHGRVELTTMAPFAGDRFAQSEVRAYRAAMADADRPTFGLDVLNARPSEVWLAEESYPSCVVESSQGRFESISFAPRGRRGAVQVVRIRAAARIRGPTRSGAKRLGRAAYTQLTPGGALPPVPSANQESLHGYVGWEETIELIDDRLVRACAAVTQSPADLVLEPGDEATVVVAIALGTESWPTMSEARDLARAGRKLLEEELAGRRGLWTGVSLEGASRGATRRAVAYAIDCAAAKTDDAVAVLADHQILPLVWTRDAYYVCRALLAFARETTFREVVDGFIRWTFDVAERVDGWWPRASLASGRAKDPVFQLDQQLYPPLLVADHARLTGDAAIRERYAPSCADLIDRLLAKRTPFGLIATAETAADDPSAQPFILSSHVLLWRLLEAFGDSRAREVREATLAHFASKGRFAYAVAGPSAERARHYHDANDLPTVFAPGWGFCGRDDPRWRGTIAFAWSPDNEGYFAGTLRGLGSLHTRHPWPLGDLQEIVVARVFGDRRREERAIDRLDRVQTWDGLLPEAYDESNGAVASRHWFAWPVALRALLESDPMLTAP
jgi:hypothetical protein